MFTPDNRGAPLLSVLHSSLRRSGDSDFMSACPACGDGILSVVRNDALELTPDDMCVACGQRVRYLDHSIAGQPVVRTEERPRRKKDWVGRRVRLRRDLESKSGNVFRAGEVMEVQRNFGGLELRALHECRHCFQGRWRAVKEVSESDVELLPASIARMADSRDPSLVLLQVRKILSDGLKYHEHDGHSLPKKVVRDALAAVGVPEEDQP